MIGLFTTGREMVRISSFNSRGRSSTVREMDTPDSGDRDDAGATLPLPGGASDRSRAEELVGRMVTGCYRIQSLIGRGAMGAVYEAEHVTTGKRVAVKVLLPEVKQTREGAGRFEREARAASFLSHPHVVEVFALDTLEGGTLALVMELVRGVSVRELIDAGAIAARRALVIARQTLEGLRHAHAHGVIHRDLKPENIMVSRAGEPGSEYDWVKLLDFGIVKLAGVAAAELGDDKLTRTGVVCGTPAYMAPEQALGRLVDGRVDLYSLAVILFEMLTGKKPFVSDDPMELLRMHVSESPPALAARVGPQPWCTDALERLVAGGLEKRPEYRFSDAGAMVAALDAAFLSLDHLPEQLPR